MVDVSTSGTDALLEETVAGEDAPQQSGTFNLRRGLTIGRYVVLDRLGAGGMGVVYSAYDPELDRKVALKVLRAEQPGERARARLLREAQAMARLSHPNVIAIYDVGTHDGRVFLAMEHVEGGTLKRWIKDLHPWREVVDVLVRAGRGLAAAHAKGLVHRDFKPDNVMIADDGRVRVMDFGLARPSASTSELSVPLRADAIELPAAPDLTMDGAVIGTPAYMAPEQYSHRGDARSDQFSFCVALYEALYGQRPFAGDSPATIAFEMSQQRLRPPPPGRSVPAWIHRVIVRGLSPDPDARYPTLADLLAQLEVDPRQRRRWVVFGTLAAAAIASAFAMRSRSDASTCEADALQAVWNDARREAVRDGLAGAGVGFAAETWTRVDQSLDAYAQAWQALDRRQCERGDPIADPRRTCMAARLQHFDATVTAFASADATLVEHAVPIVTELPAIADCEDLERIVRAAPHPGDPVAAARVAEIRGRLSEPGIASRAARYDEALAGLDDLLASAIAIDYRPLIAEIESARARTLDAAGRDEEARVAAEAAYEAAVAGGHEPAIVDAMIHIGVIEGHDLAHPERGRTWLALAKPWVQRLGDPRHDVELHVALGKIHDRESDYGGAVREYERALAILAQTQHADSLPAIGALAGLAQAQSEGGDLAAATATNERLRAIAERELGPTHPAVGETIARESRIAFLAGDLPRAKQLGEQALQQLESALGPSHPAVIEAYNRLASALMSHRDPQRAMQLWTVALERQRARLGADHPSIAVILDNQGLAYRGLDRREEALVQHREALRIREQTLGPDHTQVGVSLHNMALSLGELGRTDEARQAQERALAIFEARLGADHPNVAYVLTDLAQSMLAMHEPQGALAMLERAVRIRESHPGDPAELARTLRGLAEAHWDLGRDRPHALAIAERARQLLVEGGEPYARSVAEVDEWLKTHRLPRGR